MDIGWQALGLISLDWLTHDHPVVACYLKDKRDATDNSAAAQEAASGAIDMLRSTESLGSPVANPVAAAARPEDDSGREKDFDET